MPNQSTSPNILYIHSHDTGRYVSPYGYPVRTPNLERFADQGVVFRNHFCNNPTCSPSRACLLTGQYAHNNGMLGLAHRGWCLNDHSHHLNHTLKSHGYHTALCGIQHVARMAGTEAKLGYDDQIDSAGRAEQRADDACAYLRDYAGHQADVEDAKPLFMSIGLFETHRVFPNHEPADDPQTTMPAGPFPDTSETREDFADYATMAHRLDSGIGRVLSTLEHTGLDANTLVIITTDHGIAFPAMKCNLTDHGLGVMLMMRGPTSGPGSVFHGGQTIDAMTQHIDLFPTLCDLIGIEHPDWLQGRSLLPLMRDETDRLHDEIFAEVNYHAAYEPKRGVRTDRYKYIKRFHDDDRPVLANCDASISKTFWRNHGWDDQRIDREYLFDLIFDPHETANLADRAEYATVLDQLKARLDHWMQRTDDPILQGPIPLTEGGYTNTHAQDEPQDPTVSAAEFDPSNP